MIPLYKTTSEVKAAQPQAEIMITAEGIPERLARGMNEFASSKNVTVIGLAIVGGLFPLHSQQF